MSGQTLALNTQFGAKAVGTGVDFFIGNANMTMDYETALRMSQVLRMAAKEAKRNAGDTSRSWRIIGNLTDAEENDKLHQRREF